MNCEKCNNERLRIMSVIDTPIIEEGSSDTLLTFTIKCLTCEHEFKKEYLEG